MSALRRTLSSASRLTSSQISLLLFDSMRKWSKSVGWVSGTMGSTNHFDLA